MRAALVALGVCACMRGSSKDDRAAPAATVPAEANAAQSTAPSAAPAPVAPAGSGAAVPIDSVASARAAVGKRVRLEGTGDNAKLGAVVVKGDLIVYCIDRKDGWDDRNVPVVVEGVLEYSSRAKARTGSDGSVSAGTGEPIFQMACDLAR
jgi:hypothetical protein